MDIFLQNSYIRNDSWMTDFDFLTYTGLRIIYKKNDSDYYISLNQIIIALFGKLNVSQRIRSGIKQSLHRFMGIENGEMSEKSFIKPIAFLDKYLTEFHVDLSGLWFDSKKSIFIKVTKDEIRKILNIKYTGSVETVFRYYCVILSTINNTDNTGVGSYSLKKLRSYIDSVKAESTQLNYNKILENCGVLYIHHNDYLYYDKSSLKAMPNCYGKYENKANIDHNADLLYQSVRHTIKLDYDVNKERSLRQKYNTIISKNKLYSDTELLELKSAAEKINKKFIDIIKNTDDEIIKSTYINKLYNPNVFTKDFHDHPEKYEGAIVFDLSESEDQDSM